MDFSYHMPADLRFGRGLADKIGDICKEIAARQLGKIFIDFKHVSNPLFL